MKTSQNSWYSNYFVGIVWFVVSLIVSASNDLIVKLLSELPSMQVAFMRFGFGCVSLIPFMIWHGRSSFSTGRIWIHIIRGMILFLAMSMWCYSLGIVPIIHATLITFTIPLFVLMLAWMFLKERIQWHVIVATIVGFGGAVLSFNVTNSDFHIGALLLLVAAFLFATLDIINKKFATSETTLSMLFYSALVTTMLGAIPAYLQWQPLTIQQVLILAILGVGGNLILYCLLRAFALVQASAVAPYRYLELVFSGLLGLLVFGDMPDEMLLIGSCLIIPSTVFIAIYEQRMKRA
jgi:S-adenosylmethionine uptake transporter